MRPSGTLKQLIKVADHHPVFLVLFCPFTPHDVQHVLSMNHRAGKHDVFLWALMTARVSIGLSLTSQRV